ncbi:MAG: hypothetical protein LDL33_11095 [Desulfomonile sp.]|nr:hypothetical protein [Desulfomonile sp.]
MADEKKYKTPEELGLAVGQKIEELFSGAFGEPTAEESPSEPAAVRAPDPKPVPAQPPKPVQPPRRVPPFDEVMDRVEALILNLEWEAKADTIREAAQRFRELERFFPQDEQARAVVGMNYRVLRRHEAPDISPHPQLVKLLQDSAQALRAMRAHGKGGADRTLVSAIVKTYNQIAADAKAPPPTPAPTPQAPTTAPGTGYAAVLGQVGSTVTSLEEVGQRLARIVARLKQGDRLTEEEITRRLGTLETLLSERINRLASLQREMVRLGPPGGSPEPQRPAAAGGPDGLLMIDWGGVGLAIPSSFVTGLYPLPKPQAEQFLTKATIMLGNRQVPRLPLKKPQNAPIRSGILPSWLIHLSSGGKEYFLLGDRALGFRRSPQGVDLAKETRIKIGNASYLVLNQAVFR